MLSYVVSLLPPTILRDLQLERHGYHVYPQGPYFVPYPDGRSLQLPTDPARRRAEIAKFSDKDADAYERWDAWLHGLAEVLGPLLSAVPPKLGSRRPADLRAQAALAVEAARRLGVRGVGRRDPAVHDVDRRPRSTTTSSRPRCRACCRCRA